MSFDDVARRMQQRQAQVLVPTDREPPVMRPAPNAAALERQMIEAERRSARGRDIALGSFLLVIGLLITAVTYDSASRQGGTYVVAYGPIIFGGWRLFRGFMA